MNNLFRTGINVVATIITVGILFNSAVNAASDLRPDDNCKPRCATIGLDQSVNLSWTAPTTRTDGEPLALSELEGYRIYYGTDSDDLTPLVDLNDSSTTNYSVADLNPGLYYFSVTAYDFTGLESGFSQIVSKEIL